MRRFAENTKVPVAQTIAEIPVLLARYGGDRFQHIVTSDRAAFQFSYAGLTISFGFTLPSHTQGRQRIYRAVKLAIQAKLESVASGIEEPAQAFGGHVVLPGGALLLDKMRQYLPAPSVK
jgi:hypothetical protein